MRSRPVCRRPAHGRAHSITRSIAFPRTAMAFRARSLPHSRGKAPPQVSSDDANGRVGQWAAGRLWCGRRGNGAPTWVSYPQKTVCERGQLRQAVKPHGDAVCMWQVFDSYAESADLPGRISRRGNPGGRAKADGRSQVPHKVIHSLVSQGQSL